MGKLIYGVKYAEKGWTLPSTRYKSGKQLMSRKEHARAEEHYRNNKADFIQPYEKKKYTNEMSVNPEFVKRYGHPEKSNFESKSDTDAKSSHEN